MEVNEGGMGTYAPEVEDPEHANAGRASCWELELLSRHYHPKVREAVKGTTSLFSSASLSQPDKPLIAPPSVWVPIDPPFVLYNQYNTVKGGFRPPPPNPPLHPLQNLVLKERKKGEKKAQKEGQKEGQKEEIPLKRHFIRGSSEPSPLFPYQLADGVDFEEEAREELASYFEKNREIEDKKTQGMKETLEKMETILRLYEEFKEGKEKKLKRKAKSFEGREEVSETTPKKRRRRE